jgi:AraC family ethanolamine operon transcriptional activator
MGAATAMASFRISLGRGAATGVRLAPRRASSGVEVVDALVASAEDLAEGSRDVHYCQLGGGQLRGRRTGIRTPEVALFLETWSVGMLKRGRVPSGYVTCLVPLCTTASSRLQARPAEAGDVAVVFGDESFDYRSAESAQLVSVTFARAALERRVRALGGRTLAELRLRGRLDRLKVDPADLRETCLGAVARASEGARSGARDPFPLELEARLARLFFGPRAERDAAVTEGSPSARSRALAWKAEAWLRECLAEPPTVADLCAAVGAGERTLHEAFREHLGTTPMAYLKTLRLNAARQDLCRAGTTSKVTDVALDWGFLHFGWFSQDYRRLFGETPSQTLQRARVAAASPAPSGQEARPTRRPLYRDGHRATA